MDRMARRFPGMGSDFRDVNNDGLPDIWHTAVEFETFPLYGNRGQGDFADWTANSGLARLTSQMSGWGNGIVDFDNDGWKDLFVARSNVLDNISGLVSERQYPERNSVFRNLRQRKIRRCEFRRLAPILRRRLHTAEWRSETSTTTGGWMRWSPC